MTELDRHVLRSWAWRTGWAEAPWEDIEGVLTSLGVPAIAPLRDSCSGVPEGFLAELVVLSGEPPTVALCVSRDGSEPGEPWWEKP